MPATPMRQSKPVAVMVVYNNARGGGDGAQEIGHHQARRPRGKLGAPVFDAGQRCLPLFAKANGVSNVTWVSMDPPLRDHAHAR